MNQNPTNQQPQRSKYILARAIGGALAVGTGFAVCKAMGIDIKNFWPFMILVVGGSFVGSILGVIVAQKMATK